MLLQIGMLLSMSKMALMSHFFSHGIYIFYSKNKKNNKSDFISVNVV